MAEDKCKGQQMNFSWKSAEWSTVPSFSSKPVAPVLSWVWMMIRDVETHTPGL
jgi:hypothetical protein